MIFLYRAKFCRAFEKLQYILVRFESDKDEREAESEEWRWSGIEILTYRRYFEDDTADVQVLPSDAAVQLLFRALFCDFICLPS